jgi:osmoprotectant transport system permease protein
MLLLAAWGVLAGLPLVSSAPNRLLSGQGQSLWRVLQSLDGVWQTGALALALGTGACLVGLCLPAWQKRSTGFLLVLLGLGVWALSALAGQFAAGSGAASGGLGRVSVSSAYWLVLLLAWLAAKDALRRLQATAWAAWLCWALALAGLLALLASGALDGLSLIKEYSNRQEDFWRAFGQHLNLIGLTCGFTLLIGLPLGVAVHRRPSWAARVFPPLNLVQTIPSLALFGLLIALLAWLGRLFPVLPAWGIQGIGLAPAVLALTLYSLLPLARSTAEGLSQVPRAVTESGRAMGLSASQLFWQLELPLAFPVILSGLKVMLVQTIGLSAVAALIGAGGLGALMFEGLFSSALDLVLLAVMPIVVLTWLAEVFFGLLTRLSNPWSGA